MSPAPMPLSRGEQKLLQIEEAAAREFNDDLTILLSGIRMLQRDLARARNVAEDIQEIKDCNARLEVLGAMELAATRSAAHAKAMLEHAEKHGGRPSPTRLLPLVA